MTSHLRVNMAAVALLLIAFLFGTCVRAYDFDELSMEDDVGSFTQGDLTNIIDTKASDMSSTGTVHYKDDVLRLIWAIRSPLIPFVGNFKPFKNIEYPKKVAVCDCALPTSTLAQALKDLNINVPTIEFLQYVVRNISEPLPTADYLQGLNLKTLFIDTVSSPEDLFEKNPQLLKPLSNLTTLIVSGTKIPKVPENIDLKVLSLRHNATVKEWPACKDLKVLSINTVTASSLPSYWPKECQNLTKIRLKDLTKTASQQIISNFNSSLVNLETLSIENCNLTDLPDEFLKNAKNLKYLNLTRNRITDKILSDVPFLQNLTVLDLRNNCISSLKNISIPESIEWIDLRGNQLTSLNHSDLVQLFKNPKRHILLSNNSFLCDCELVAVLKEFHAKVEDFQNITCENSKKLQELSTEKVCRKVSYNWAFIITAGVVFVIKIICLTWWYWNHVKRFFYRHGCCRCCCISEINDTVAWQSVEPTIALSQQDLVESDTNNKS